MNKRLTVSTLALAVLSSTAYADQTRSSTFEYYTTDGSGASLGLLKAEVVEPVGVSTSGNADNCLRTQNNYDTHGNKTSTTVQACSGVSASANFTARTSSITMDSNAQYAVSSTNAKNQSETYNATDTRFGIVTSQTGPNGLTSTVNLDELGRKIKQTAPDSSYSVVNTYSCLSVAQQGYDSSDVSAGVVQPDPQGSACNLISFAHPTSGITISASAGTLADYAETQSYAANGTAQGGVVRVYHDTLGREVATIKTGLDLPGQSTFYLRTLKAYDSKGRAAYTSTVEKVDASGTPLSGSTRRWSVATFDSLGRASKSFTPDDSGVTSYSDTTADSGVAISSLTGAAKIGAVNLNTDAQVTSTQVTSNGPVTLSVEESNAMGQLLRKTDTYGNQIVYSYDELGQLVATKDGAGNQTALYFDIRGRKTQQNDPDLGNWTYAYDALGQLVSQKDANLQTQSMSYDVLGRVTQKVTPEFTANYVYDCNQASNLSDSSTFTGIGSLCQESTTNNYNKLTAYDNLGRVIHTRTVIGTGTSQKTYDSRQSFDSLGRVANTTYPTGVQTTPQYSANGFTIGINRTDSGLNQSLWAAKGLDQWGSIQQWQLGNGLITTSYSDIQGRLTSKNTGTISTPQSLQNVQYTYNQLGDLASRQDTIDNLTETFNQDNLHRLIQWNRQSPYQSNGSYTVGYSYDGIGNLTYRSDRGCFTYPAGGSVRPHAVTTLYSSDCSNTSTAGTVTSFVYDANGSANTVNQNSSTLRSHAWTSFHQPSSITWNPGTATQTQWLYGPDFNRIQETKLINAGGTWTVQQQIYKLNPGNVPYFEQTVNTASGSPTENRHYIATPIGMIGTLVTNGDIGSGTTTSNATARYWHTDHLGSLTVLTDNNGNALERFQYDPYGVRLDGNGHAVTASLYTDRGFTQHEHIDNLGLIHMNGRIFDPIMGRFLSADTHVTVPTFLQSYNRYSYCVNGPMLCTDPSGFDFWSNLKDDVVDGWHSVWRDNTSRIILSVAVAVAIGPEGLWAESGGIAGAAGMSTGAAFSSSLAAGFAGGYIASQGNLQASLIGAATAGAFYGIGDQFAAVADQNTEGFMEQLANSNGGQYSLNLVGKTGLTASQLAGKVAEHALVGGVSSYASGGKFGSGALAGGFGEIGSNATLGASEPMQFASATILGGTASVIGGGKFSNGAQTAAFGYLFNCLPHECWKKYPELTKYKDIIELGNIDWDKNMSDASKISIWKFYDNVKTNGDWDGSVANF